MNMKIASQYYCTLQWEETQCFSTTHAHAMPDTKKTRAMPCQQGGLSCNWEKYSRVGGIMKEDKRNKHEQALPKAQLCKRKATALCKTKTERESTLPSSDIIHNCRHWPHTGQLQWNSAHTAMKASILKQILLYTESKVLTHRLFIKY